MMPSKSPYSSGWSSTWTARRLSARLGEGPFGTAQDRSTPSISRRRSQWSRRAACIWTTNRPPAEEAVGAARAPGSGVWSRERFARYVLSGSGPGFRFEGIGVKSYPMSAHPLGSATLSFGLVSVPIKLFSTGESSAAISFNWLHKKDGARLKQQYVCSKDGDKVEKDEMVKGYEFTKGQYVIFKPENYEDNVRKRVLEQIQRKVEGKEITEEPAEAPKTQIIDLMEALKASLKAKGIAGERKPAKRVEGNASKAASAAKRKVGGARG